MRRIKTMIALACALALLAGLCGAAAAGAEGNPTSGSCGDGVSWSLDGQGTLTIFGAGRMEDYSRSPDTPWYASRDSIRKLVVGEGVTYIGELAFCLDTLEEVLLPGSLDSIGWGAFMGARALGRIDLPEGLTRIGPSVFYGCSSLTSVTLPTTLAFLHNNVFYGCSSLAAISFRGANPYFSVSDGILFDRNRTTLIWYPLGKTDTSYTVPGTVRKIYQYAFCDNASLESVSLSASLVEIGDYAFASCKGLTSITLPDSLTQMGEAIFLECTGLTDVTLPAMLETVPRSSFEGCRGLKTIAIPGNVKVIGNEAFEGCDSLDTIAFPVSLTHVCEDAFCGDFWLKTVRYAGLREEYDAIQIDSNNHGLEHATVLTFELYSYTVTFSANGGTGAPDSERRTQNTTMRLPTGKPVRTGYNFLGWATSSYATAAQYQPGDAYTLEADAVLYAVWQLKTFTVSYHANGGTSAPASQTKYYGRDLKLSTGRPTRSGYAFQGWAMSSTGPVAYQPGDSYTIDGYVTLYAVWQKNGSYTVSYDANGGSGAPQDQVKAPGQALTLSAVKPVRTGYTFLGWATSRNGSVAYQPGAAYSADASVTLYALWLQKTYTVSYDANGGAGAPQSQDKLHDVALTLSTVEPTRANYSFLGWAAGSTDAVAYRPGDTYTANANVTLRAVWQEQADNSFDVARDAWAFANSQQGFGYSSTGSGLNYPVPYHPSFTLMFEDNMVSKNLYVSQYQSKSWAGNCCGMASTVSLMTGGDSVRASDFGKQTIGALALSSSNGAFTAKTFIEAMQFAQSTYAFSKAQSDHMVKAESLDRLDALYTAVKQGTAQGHPVLIGIGLRGLYGHALLAYGTQEVSAAESRMLIYDCNHPGEARSLPVYRNAQGKAIGWKYDMGGYGEWGTQGSFASNSFISYVGYETLRHIWDNRARKSTYGLLLVDADNLSITDIDGNVQARLSGGALVTSRSDIFEVADLTLGRADMHGIYLPRDFYTIASGDGGTLGACFANGDVSAEVSTTAYAVSFLVDATYGFNTVYVENAGTSDTFSVTLSSSASGVKYNNVEVSGTGKGESICISGDNDSLSLSNCNLLSLSINGQQQLSYVVTAIAGEGGRIEPSGDVQVPVDSAAIFTIVPDPGYRIQEVLLDGLRYGTGSRITLKNVMKAHTVSVSFMKAYQIKEAIFDPTTGKVQVDLLNENRSTLLCASYDAAGRMLGVNAVSAAADCGTVSVDIPGGSVPRGGRVQIMLVDAQWRPLCASRELSF